MGRRMDLFNLMKRGILPIRCLIHPHIIISDICDECREDKINLILKKRKGIREILSKWIGFWRSFYTKKRGEFCNRNF